MRHLTIDNAEYFFEEIISKISISLFGKSLSRTLSGCHAQTKKDRALWFCSTGPQQTNLNLQTGLRSNGGSVPEKSRFSDNCAPPRVNGYFQVCFKGFVMVFGGVARKF